MLFLCASARWLEQFKGVPCSFCGGMIVAGVRIHVIIYLFIYLYCFGGNLLSVCVCLSVCLSVCLTLFGDRGNPPPPNRAAENKRTGAHGDMCPFSYVHMNRSRMQGSIATTHLAFQTQLSLAGECRGEEHL
jgi:hypothetical protein